MGKVDVKAVRNAVYRAIGSRVVVKANRGRHRFDVNEGVIFRGGIPLAVKWNRLYVDAGDNHAIINASSNAGKTVSYTYTDILTKDVQLQLCTQ